LIDRALGLRGGGYDRGGREEEIERARRKACGGYARPGRARMAGKIPKSNSVKSPMGIKPRVGKTMNCTALRQGV